MTIIAILSLFTISINTAYAQLEDIEDIEEYFGINKVEENFSIYTNSSRLSITNFDAVQIYGEIPSEMEAKNRVIFLNVTYPDGKIIKLKTLTNDRGYFYMPYILEIDDNGISEGTYNILGWFENNDEIIFANTAFWTFDPAKEDATKKIIKINEGAASFECKRKDECFNPSTITIEKSTLIEFQNIDKETHYIVGLDVDGNSVFSTGVLTPDEKDIINSQRLDIGAFYIYCKYHPWIQGAINIIEPEQDKNPYSKTTIQIPVPKKIVESVSIAGFSAILESDSNEYSMGEIVRIALLLNENTKLNVQIAIYGPDNFMKLKNLKVNENTGVGFIEFFIDSSHAPGDYIAKISFTKGFDRIELSTGFTVIENNENKFCQGDQSICFGGKVDRVIDGDTIVIENIKVRLSLTNTPEKDEPGYVNATEFTKSFCPENSLAFVDVDDLQKKDTYGRTLGVVLCNEQNLNENLLKNNQAEISTGFCGISEFTNSTWAQKYGCEGINNRDIINENLNRIQNPIEFDFGGGCLIATATYGTELAPQVQELRELRTSLTATKSGSGFMERFNTIYYSFSPAIADLERDNKIFREIVKIGITPMISILSMLNYFSLDSEIKALVYGIAIIIIIVVIYVGVPGVAAYAIFKQFKKNHAKIFVKYSQAVKNL